MATTYQKRLNQTGQPTIPKTRTKKTISQPPSKIKTNDPKDIKIRFGNNTSRTSMHQPPSILKRKTFDRPQSDLFNENFPNLQQPGNLESMQPRSFYSPIHTPPRLRRLLTPSGIGLHRNHYNLRGLTSPLPALDRYSPPVNLDTWGIGSADYLNSNLNLMRRHPSPLTQFGLSSGLQRNKKSYIVVPRLTNLVSPPVSSGGGTFTLPSRRKAPVYIPESRYTYIDRIHSFASPQLHRAPSDYVYMRQNEAFANHYVDDFIGKCIEDQFIPDILLEIIGELNHENKKRGGKSYQTAVDSYYTELNRRIHQEQADSTHLFSDDWLREVDYQNSNRSSVNPLGQTTNRVRYQDLPPDVQGRLLADINQELVDFEIENMTAELGGQTVTTSHNTSRSAHYYSEPNTQRNQVDQVQYNAIQTFAQDKLLDTTCLNRLIIKCIKQHGSIVDVDELSRLLDATVLGNLIYQYQDIDENRSRTLDNYSSKKFHLNTFMNVTMDLLLTELSGSLIEDMKDLDEQE